MIKTAVSEMNKEAEINFDKGGIMKRLWSLMLATIMLITFSGCFWGVEHDRRDRDGYRHDDHRDHDGDRGPYDRR